jgi:hypothetical protein
MGWRSAQAPTVRDYLERNAWDHRHAPHGPLGSGAAAFLAGASVRATFGGDLKLAPVATQRATR